MMLPPSDVGVDWEPVAAVIVGLMLGGLVYIALRAIFPRGL